MNVKTGKGTVDPMVKQDARVPSAESDVEKQEIDKEKGNYQASELEKKLFMEAASHLRVEQVVESIKVYNQLLSAHLRCCMIHVYAQQ